MIKARELRNPAAFGPTSREPLSFAGTDHGNPMSRYRDMKFQGARYASPWKRSVCVVTAEDGSFGVGMTSHAGPVNVIINDYFAPLLEGRSVYATDLCWDIMVRTSASHFGAQGLASYAVSAVDLALWDLKGKLLTKPVYELMGGPTAKAIHCYATTRDVEWAKELGFDAIKIATTQGSAEPAASIQRNVIDVENARRIVGEDLELMVDFWNIGDTQFTIELAERLRPYRLKWVEDYSLTLDEQALTTVRCRLPWQTLASGERWYTPYPFQRAAANQVVDIFQPDIQWVGGATAIQKINAIAESASISMALHRACDDSYGQHLSYAMTNAVWGEFLLWGGRNVPLEDNGRYTPGMSLPENGKVVPSDAPGFGLALSIDTIESAT